MVYWRLLGWREEAWNRWKCLQRCTVCSKLSTTACHIRQV